MDDTFYLNYNGRIMHHAYMFTKWPGPSTFVIHLVVGFVRQKDLDQV